MTTGGNGLEAQAAAAGGYTVPVPVALALVRLARHLKIPLSHDAPPTATMSRNIEVTKPPPASAPGIPSVARAALGPPPRPVVTPYYVKTALTAYRGVGDQLSGLSR